MKMKKANKAMQMCAVVHAPSSISIVKPTILKHSETFPVVRSQSSSTLSFRRSSLPQLILELSTNEEVQHFMPVVSCNELFGRTYAKKFQDILHHLCVRTASFVTIFGFRGTASFVTIFGF